jgi:Transcriptional regulator
VPESIDIKLKRAAIMLADELSYSRAAGRLNISPVELKRQISSLEKRLYLRVFCRRQETVELTEDGKFLIGFFRGSVAAHHRKGVNGSHDG